MCLSSGGQNCEIVKKKKKKKIGASIWLITEINYPSYFSHINNIRWQGKLNTSFVTKLTLITTIKNVKEKPAFTFSYLM